MTPWVLLDRDGVINEDSKDYIKSEKEWLAIPKSLEAIALLNNAGFRIGVATNQSGIARGLYTLAALEAIHAKMNQLLHEKGGHIDALAFCPHGPEEGCDCRKPKPGLLTTIAQEHAFSLQNVPFIGDSLRDLEAARAVGAQPILVLSGKGQDTWNNHSSNLTDVLVFNHLWDVAHHLIEQRGP